MELDSKEVRLGTTWFMVVAPIAVLLTVVLYKLDLYLGDNSRRNEDAAQLLEVRKAQFSQAPSVTDKRSANNVAK